MSDTRRQVEEGGGPLWGELCGYIWALLMEWAPPRESGWKRGVLRPLRGFFALLSHRMTVRGDFPPSCAAGGSLAGRGDGRPGARILKSGERGGKGRSFRGVCGNEAAVGCGQREVDAGLPAGRCCRIWGMDAGRTEREAL